ncbi:MAG: hypothetical protein IJ083_13135 [Clostridia bacterium]|nr:hypothetical protein [Clostridia bacterium]
MDREIFHVLSLFFGGEMTSALRMHDRCLRIFSVYSPTLTPLQTLCEQLENAVYSMLYEALGPNLVWLDDGGLHRFYLKSLPDLSEALLSVYLIQTSPSPALFSRVYDHFLQKGSLGALRALCSGYREFLRADEQAFLQNQLSLRESESSHF